MNKWRCIPCDYIYDPAGDDEEGGIGPGLKERAIIFFFHLDPMNYILSY